MTLNEKNTPTVTEKEKFDIFKDHEFSKKAPDIVALHDAIFPKHQASFRKHIENILGYPFITVEAANKRISQSNTYHQLVVEKKGEKGISGEVMQAANNTDYRPIDFKRTYRKAS